MFQRQLEMHALGLLQCAEDAREVRGRWATLGTEHTHEAFRRDMRPLFQVQKADGRIHIVAENGLTGFKVAVQDALHRLTQQGLAELRFALRPRPDGLFEVMC